MARKAEQRTIRRVSEKGNALLYIGDLTVIKDIKVLAGNWIAFKVSPPESPTISTVLFHQTRRELECGCKQYRQGKPCDHIKWLARYLSYQDFEKIRDLIEEVAGVRFEYDVIEKLWNQCLNAKNSRMYELLAETAIPIVEKNPTRTLAPKIKGPLLWRDDIRGTQWEVSMADFGFLYVRMLPVSKQKMPRRIVKMGDNDKWVSECACSFGERKTPCIHIEAAKAAYEFWGSNGFLPSEKKTDETPGVSMTDKEPEEVKEETRSDIENKVAASLGLDKTVEYVFGLDASSEESKTVVGELRNSIFGYVVKSGPFFPETYPETYLETYSEEPNPREEITDQAEPAEPIPLKEPEELPDPPKAKNRFSEMEI